MKNCVGENTVILSVMNGISSEKIIGERYGHGRLIDTVAQGMDAMKFGSKLTYTKWENCGSALRTLLRRRIWSRWQPTLMR